MESADPAERKWACVAVSNIIQNDSSTRRLLQGKNVVGILITRLSDSEEEVLVEAAGALRYGSLLRHMKPLLTLVLDFRNLCIDGGHELCGEMYNKNVLAPLKTFVPKARESLTLVRLHSDLTSKDSSNPLTVFGEPKICSRECAEGRVRVSR